MVLISILPGEFMWSARGTHILDENGMTKTATKTQTVDVAEDKAWTVYNIIMNKRVILFSTYFSGYENIWVVEPTHMSKAVSLKYTMLKDIGGGIYQPQSDFCISENTKYILPEDFDWGNIEMKPKMIPKTFTKEIDAPIEEWVDEITVVKEFDDVLGKRVAREVKTGKKVKRPIIEKLDYYDADGNFVGVEKYVVTEKKTVTENCIDENGLFIMEPDKDLMVPIYETKYLEQDKSMYRVFLLSALRIL